VELDRKSGKSAETLKVWSRRGDDDLGSRELTWGREMSVIDDATEGDDGLYESEDEVEAFRPWVEPPSSELLGNMLRERAGAD
jgi:hypothetical protein